MSSIVSSLLLEPRGAVTLTTDEAVLMTHLVVWLLAFLSVLFLGLRIGAKCFRRAGLAVDDALLAAAWVSLCSICTLLTCRPKPSPWFV